MDVPDDPTSVSEKMGLGAHCGQLVETRFLQWTPQMTAVTFLKIPCFWFPLGQPVEGQFAEDPLTDWSDWRRI